MKKTISLSILLSAITLFGYAQPKAVDLGLPSGTLWATTDVGADSPEKEGVLVAWGEVKPKDAYEFENRKYYKHGWEDSPSGNGQNFYAGHTKYTCDPEHAYKKILDNLSVLEDSDDVVRMTWGGDWQLPMSEDYQELLDKCTWTDSQLNGVKGVTITGPNGNSIFFAFNGYKVGKNREKLYTYYFAKDKCTDVDMYYLFQPCHRRMSKEYYDHLGMHARGVIKKKATNAEEAKNTSDTKNTESAKDDEVFDVIEVNPEFPGGLTAMSNFITKHIKYPKHELKNEIQGRVLVGFIVMPDGSIDDVKIVRSVTTALDNEAMRVVKSMPKWKPGMQNGQAVKVKYVLPITFKPR